MAAWADDVDGSDAHEYETGGAKAARGARESADYNTTWPDRQTDILDPDTPGNPHHVLSRGSGPKASPAGWKRPTQPLRGAPRIYAPTHIRTPH